MDRIPSTLEIQVASELSAFLDRTMPESISMSEPYIDLFRSLDYYIPQLLSSHYPEWEYEGLDGFYFANIQKIGSEIAEFTGLCILIDDQTVTPVFIRLELASSGASIASYQVFLGEPGEGRLRISGPPCYSAGAQKLLDKVSMRLNSIQWSYRVGSE